ncbi:MAG: PD40 domain-containing protein, partial [Thermodesulfovibrionia bacterium]|nr:PD40 domain-containing protein [Thermodesulfovibrionia bacterium]
LALNRQDPHFHEEIVIVDAETFEEVSSVRRMPSDHHISWSPDSEQLYFTQAELSNGYNVYQDIYSYNLKDESVSRITKDIRAKDVDVSPDGNQLVFVRVETGRQNIALLSIKRGIIEDITDMNGSALSSPRWSNDGGHVLFSKHNDSGKTSIEILNVDTGKIETLTADDSYNIHPAWSPDGKFIIFSSDRTGVYNLFAISLVDEKIYQITHVPGGAFQPDMTREKGKIFFSGYSSKGFHIAEIPYDPSEWSLTLSPEIGPSWKIKDVQQAKKYVREEALSKAIQEKKKYCPLKTVLPKFWLPTLTFDHEGAVFGAFTAGQDVLGYHSYIIEGRYGTGGNGYYNFNYVYDRWRPAFFLRGYSLPVFYSDFFRDDDNYYEKRTGVSAGLKLPLFTSIESRLSLMTGYNYAKASHLTDTYGRTVDGIELYEGRRDNVFIGLGYIGALKYPYSISREEGRNISLTYRRYDRDIGSGLDQNEYALDYEEFTGLKKHHVIYLNLKGAVSDGDLIAQQAFQVGGFPSAQNEYSIRGFQTGFQTGRYVVKSTLEYRFPIKYFFRGWNTKPFFWDRLHVAAFADAGNVWGFNRRFDLDDFSAGIGAEARIDMVLGYKMKVTPAFGVARGITDDGETQVYITIYTDL